MTEADARFEEAPLSDRPLRLQAEDREDLGVVSTLVQDAVARVGDIRWLRKRRRLVLLMNRFRWEDVPAASDQRRPFERVRAALTVNCVLDLKARGLDPGQPGAVVSVLALGWEELTAPAGRLTISLAGGAELCAEAEALEIALTDLTRPWEARAAGMPSHEV